jgi:hypothetical protein
MPENEDTSNMRIWPKKVDEPDVGTYDVPRGIKFVKSRNPQWTVNKSK